MKKWVLYALILPCLCKGGIIFTPYNGDLTPAFPSNEFTLDINNDGTPEFKFSAVMDAPLYSVDVRGLGSEEILFPEAPGAISALAISHGTRIGSDELEGLARWETGIGILSHWDLQFPIGEIKGGYFLETNAYIGIRFQINENIHYGWIQVDNPFDVPGGTLTGFAYETSPGVSIIAGAVPEPSSTILFVIGFTGIWILRKEKLSKLSKGEC